MPSQLLNIPSFEGGLNNLLDPRDIALSELSVAENIMCDKNGIIRSVGIGTQPGIGALEFITEIKAGFGLYMFESSFGAGSDGTATAGAYEKACKREHDSGINTGETVWYVMISGNDGMYVRTPSSEWTRLEETLSSTDGVNWDDISIKPVYHIADEALRISNVDYDEENSITSKNRWFGFIKKKNYFGNGTSTVASSDTDYYFNGWYFLDNDIKKPTNFNVSTGEYAIDTVDDAVTGSGFDLYIGSAEGGSHDFSPAATTDGSGNIIVTYEFASSFIYDGIQESLLYKGEGTGVSDTTAGHIIILRAGTEDANVDMALDASLIMAVGVKTGYNPRITGGRIYFRKHQSNDEWVLLVDIDFEKGCRADLTDIYPNVPWTRIVNGEDGTEDDYTSSVAVASDQPSTPINSSFLNFDTYHGLNEWTPSEPRISIGCNNLSSEGVWNNVGNDYPSSTGEGYKCSVVLNRRCFIANTALYKNESPLTAIPTGDLFRERDRIYYSAVNNFDCFPRTTHWIDVIKGDAEEYTALIGYADRLLAFKSNTLFILNISARNPLEWFLESQHSGMGIKKQCQVTQTGDGIVWANINGAYSYTGGDVRTTTTEDISIGADINTLTKGKISDESWIINGDDMAIAYIYKKKQLLIMETLESTPNSSGFIYDFTTETWTSVNTGIIFNDTESAATNFIADSQGKILYGSWDGTLLENAVNNHLFFQRPHLYPHGIDDKLGNEDSISGYTFTNVSPEDVKPYVSAHPPGGIMQYLHITQPISSEEGERIPPTACYFEYTTLSLRAAKEYRIIFSLQSLASNILITVSQKVSGGAYETVGESFQADYSHPWLSFDEGFITTTENTYTVKVKLEAIGYQVPISAQMSFFNVVGELGGSQVNIASFYTFDNINFVNGTLDEDRFNLLQNSINIQTKDIDFGQPGLNKKIYALYMTHRTPTSAATQTTPVSYATDGGTSFTNLTGNITATGGAWTVSKFYSAIPIECQSIRFKVTNPSAVGMLEINDMAIEYRQIHKRVA